MIIMLQQKNKTKITKQKNPFDKYKDIQIHSRVNKEKIDFNYYKFNKCNEDYYEISTFGKMSALASAITAPIAIISNGMTQINTVIISSCCAVVAFTFYHTSKIFKKYINEYKDKIKNFNKYEKEYLYKKMYTEYYEGLKKNKKLFVDTIGYAGSIITGGYVYTLTNMNEVKMAMGILISGYTLYMTKRISSFIGSKKVIKHVEEEMKKY